MLNSENFPVQDIINSYYGLPIDYDGQSEEIWIKKLRSILNTDIHEDSLGCRIDDTHVKIGNIHMNSFFEARFMFSQQKWIIRFAGWLKKQLDIENSDETLIIGYETYLEPVLAHLKLDCGDKIEYCIYEVGKHLSANPDDKTKTRLRYIENVNSLVNLGSFKFKKIVFLCGISSSLSTYEAMKNYLKEIESEPDLKAIKTLSNKISEYTYFALIQVLPITKESSFSLGKENEKNIKLTWNLKNKTVSRYNNNDLSIHVKYLVNVYSKWQYAENCIWCFGKKERPLIDVDDTSVVPQQIIKKVIDIPPKIQLLEPDKSKVDFFENKDLSSCLYYKHIERGGNHYQYYIRTAKLFWEIVHNDELIETFKNFCNNISSKLKIEEGNKVINVIITPIHYSNVLFPSYINKFVFNGNAHIITMEPKKEYRSNFVTKYSNYSYLNKQCKNGNTTIRFHYVDDQIVSGSTFFRAESLVRSLKQEFYSENFINESVFDSTIILLNRISSESQKNYISNKKFFSLIDISVSHLRNYGDACPLCKQTNELKCVAEKSSLIATRNYWNGKAEYHQNQSLQSIKKSINNYNEKKRTLLSHRYFLRFKCENYLTKIADFYDFSYLLLEQQMYEAIRNSLTKVVKKQKYELLISYIKVLSRPFLYYRENIKKFTLKFLNELLSSLLKSESSNKRIIIKKETFSGLYDLTISASECYIEQYYLLCVILNQLSSIGSNYLLKINNIEDVFIFVNELKEKLKKDVKSNKYEFSNNITGFSEFSLKLKSNEYNLIGIGAIIANNFKRIICGLSGTHKIEWANRELNSEHILCKKRDFEKYAQNAEGEKFKELKLLLFKLFYILKNLNQFEKDIEYTFNIENKKYIGDLPILYKIIEVRYSKRGEKYKNYCEMLDYMNHFDENIEEIINMLNKNNLSKILLERRDINECYEKILRYFRIIYKKICLAEMYNNSYRVYKNLQDTLEIIYFENCHTNQPSGKNFNIEELLVEIQSDTELKRYLSENEKNITLCLKNDINDQNNKYIFFKTIKDDQKNNYIIDTNELLTLFKNQYLEEREIIDSIKNKGFFYCEKKWLILLKKENDNENDQTDAFLFISFNEDVKLDIQFWQIKKTIKDYRCKLTNCIEEGIKNGSLYANIKKNIAKSVLSSDKTQSHGKSLDMVNLYKLVKNRLLNLESHSTINEKTSTYTAINILMNRIISAGAIKKVYRTYFGINNEFDPICNLMQKAKKDDKSCFEQLKIYLDFISSSNNNYINSIHNTYFNKKGLISGSCKIEVDYSKLKELLYVPQLLSKFENISHEDSAIWLIGIIDVFIRNAIRHSPNCDDSIIKIYASQEQVEKIALKNGANIIIRNYSFTIKNRKKHILENAEELHLTHKFFMDYLPTRSEGKNNFYCNTNGTDDDMYVLNVYFQYNYIDKEN